MIVFVLCSSRLPHFLKSMALSLLCPCFLHRRFYPYGARVARETFCTFPISGEGIFGLMWSVDRARNCHAGERNNASDALSLCRYMLFLNGRSIVYLFRTRRFFVTAPAGVKFLEQATRPTSSENGTRARYKKRPRFASWPFRSGRTGAVIHAAAASTSKFR